MDKRTNINWVNFKKGDFMIYPSGDRSKVLGRVGCLLARSACHQFDTFQQWMTIQDAQRAGLRFIQKGNKTEMTEEEVSILMGHPVKIIKKQT